MRVAVLSYVMSGICIQRRTLLRPEWTTTSGSDAQQFLIHDSGVDAHNRMLVFRTEQGMQHLLLTKSYLLVENEEQDFRNVTHEDKSTIYTTVNQTEPEVRLDKAVQVTSDILCDLSTSYCGMDFMDGSRTPVKSKPKDEIQPIDITPDPASTPLSIEVRTIKIEKEDSQSSVLGLSDCSTQEIECEVKVEAVQKGKTKNEAAEVFRVSGVKGAVTPVWSSLVEIETMKDKNKESRIADIESSDASSEDIEQENVDEGNLQEQHGFYLLSMFDNNVKDNLETNCGSSMNESEVSNDEVYECKFCHASFTENSLFLQHMHTHAKKNLLIVIFAINV
ncbi:hypothetical protein GQR58_025876 [Nymphon striatum]|nr:hypothetical protein GQR58_025876 [Nymphon striatum]